MSTTTKIGVIIASDHFSETWLRRCLPPEHAIIAVKPVDGGAEYLISGALMTPGYVKPLFTMHRLDHGIRLTGEIGGSAWTIGEWPSLEAFQTERENSNA